jgi:hypothetical protein
LSDSEYARLLSEIWTDTEQPSRILNSWIELFTNPRLKREYLMSPEELAYYHALPDQVQIWRGAGHPCYARGISWTTDTYQAAWFAVRFARNEGSVRIFSVTVSRKAIIAYFSGGTESEVIIDPRSLGTVQGLPRTTAEITAADRRKQNREHA